MREIIAVFSVLIAGCMTTVSYVGLTQQEQTIMFALTVGFALQACSMLNDYGHAVRFIIFLFAGVVITIAKLKWGRSVCEAYALGFGLAAFSAYFMAWLNGSLTQTNSRHH
jgi:hypothetical protein